MVALAADSAGALHGRRESPVDGRRPNLNGSPFPELFNPQLTRSAAFVSPANTSPSTTRGMQPLWACLVSLLVAISGASARRLAAETEASFPYHQLALPPRCSHPALASHRHPGQPDNCRRRRAERWLSGSLAVRYRRYH